MKSFYLQARRLKLQRCLNALTFFLRKSSYCAFLTLLIISCSTKQNDHDEDIYASLPPTYSEMLKSHGGLATWRSFGALEFDLKHEKDSIATEHYTLDLVNRKDLTVADSFKIGFDGTHVWVAPNRNAYKGRSARFYHNLYSYFISMPFIVADPGVKYAMDTLSVDGKRYDVVNVSFSEGVGDADTDTYKILIDPETHKMEMLLYTVTFYSGQAHENYNALSYENWTNINGVELATTLVGYKYGDGKTGDKRYEVKFNNLKLLEQRPDQNLFVMPAQAEIDSFKND